MRRDQREALDYIGDGEWWERVDCFSHPQCRAFVPDLDAVKEELRVLFPAEVCKTLIKRDQAAHVLPLFFGSGWMDHIDELLQLGSDLTLCTGWRHNFKLLADLRNPAAYAAARFEVGVWAGLRRVGLEPDHEVAPNRAQRRPDFMVVDEARRVAIELKSLGDPQRERNEGLLQSRLSFFASSLLSEAIGSVVLEPAEALDAMLDARVEESRELLDDRVWPAISAVLNGPIALGRVDVEELGTLVVGPRDPDWPANVMGSVDVKTELAWPQRRVAHRVLSKVAAAQRQLAATTADLRVVVVWGSFDHVPCNAICHEISRLVATGHQAGAVDFVGLLNSHRRRPGRGWTTEAALLAMREGLPPPASMTWPKGLTKWSRLHAG